MDCDKGALLVPASQGQCSDPGGGKHPPPMVPPVKDYGAVECPEWDTHTHSTVQPRLGAEEAGVSGGGGEGGNCQGLQRLWAPPGDGDLLQIPETGDIVIR